MYYKTYKVKLHPNNKQHTKMLNIGFTCIALYNALLNTFSKRDDNDNLIYKYPNVFELRKTFTIVKEHLINDKSKELNGYGLEIYNILKEYFSKRNYSIYEISNDSLKQTIKDYHKSMISFFKKEKGYPKEKKYSLSNIGFYCDPIKIKLFYNCVKLEKLTLTTKNNRYKLNYVSLAGKGRIPLDGVTYYNPRIKYDGINWWLSIGVETDSNESKNTSPHSDEVIGIDMGIKQTYLSNGINYRSINSTRRIKLLTRKLKRLQRKLSKSKLINKKITKNYKKNLREIRKIQIKLTNLRHSHQDKIINDIKKINPRKIIIEDLNIKHMMKNKHLARKIGQEEFYRFRLKIKECCDKLNIILVIANRYYPSSKMCSSCGKIKKGLKLSDRVYKCECGIEIDRDYNAAINLSRYI